MWTWFYKLASPPYVYGVTAALTPWFLGLAVITIVYGLVAGLIFAPPDYQQGDAFRIIYVHAPSAWMSLFSYTSMAIAGAIALIWRIKMGHAVAAASAPIGASFTLLALFTGSLWGRPMWGTYWAWDPRLTSELILLFLYAGVMSLRSAFEDPARGDRAAALLGVVGLVNVPIIHYSVLWWNSLHQGATIAKIGKPSMPGSMLWPLLSMLLGFMFFYGAVLCMRLQGEVLNRERQAKWVREAIKS
ncbi:MAG TPA: heme ABC transporter permease [Steroidobacteraceae bacterium]|jgi:heme exporter protein C|nr:heme ABC transporter permease [Steroidobacteraceae bacterium]